MENSLIVKLKKLETIIREFPSALIAYSGGVDSTFLASVAHEVLGDNLLLVTASSSSFPDKELEHASTLAQSLGIRHKVIVSEELDIPGFSENTPDRCYYCKSGLFSILKDVAKEEGLAAVFEGTNHDDLSDYRPGRRALAELSIRSPLVEAGLSKNEIRELSKMRGLSTASKPSYACLASRFPYGEHITREKLDRVQQAELQISELGFAGFRVRSHESIARIEFNPDDIERAFSMRNSLVTICKDAGFLFVALDLEGYHTGSLNRVLDL